MLALLGLVYLYVRFRRQRLLVAVVPIARSQSRGPLSSFALIAG